MSQPINNRATSDQYTAAMTLPAPGSVRLNIHAANASVYYQLARGNAGVAWGADVFVPAGAFRSLDRVFDAVRVRSATPGKPAQVTLEALSAQDIG